MKRLLPLLSAVILSAPLSAGAQAAAPVSEDVSAIHLRAGELPAVELTRDLLYRILVAELAGQRGLYEQASQLYLELAQDTLDPRLAKRSFLAAMVTHDTARAYQAARLWALLAPDDSEAAASAMALAATSGRPEDLVATLARRIRTAPVDEKDRAIVQALDVVSKIQDKRVALEVLDKALGPDTRDLPMARLALSDVAWAALDAWRALEEARAGLALDPASEAAAQRVLEYGMEVEPDTVLRQTQEWLADHPDARRLSLMLVGHLVNRRQYEAALAQVRRLRQRSPEDFDLLYTEADVQFNAGNDAEAERLLYEYIQVQDQRRASLNERATNALAEASDAHLLLVRIAERQQDWNKALAALDAIDDNALRFQVLLHKAVLQARLGQLVLAAKTLDDAAPRDDHERAVVALTMASIYRNAGRTDSAVQVLVDADREIPDSPEIKYDLAMLYERQGRSEQFESLLREVMVLAPDHANAYNSLGYTYANQNRRLDEAHELLERAIELEPDNPYILDSVGWYFYRVNDYEAAIDYLRRAFRALSHAEVGAHLGEVLWMSGRKDEAMRIWREARDDDAENDTLAETLKRLGISLP
ncbi:MAG: tetratricopeptide repeat protein [Castellaniella sp.]